MQRVYTNDVLYEEGADDQTLKILLSGKCQIRKKISDRGLGQIKEIVLENLSGPAVVGEIGFVDKQPSTETVIIKESGYVWIINQRDLDLIFSSEPELGYQLFTLLNKLLVSKIGFYRSESIRNEKSLEPVANLNRNENPHFSESVKTAILNNVSKGTLNRYPDAYSENVVAKLSDRFGLPEQNIVVTPGSSVGLDIFVTSYVKEADNVTILVPTFEVFGFSARRLKANVKEYCYKDPYKVDLKELFANVDANTDIFYIANPTTPTGLYHTNEEIAAMLEHYPKALFVIDEAYIEFTTNPDGVLSLLDTYPSRIVIVRTMSKAYGLAGLRIGYIIANPKIIAPIKSSIIPYAVNSLSQVAACTILDEQEEVRRRVEQICQQREYMAQELRNLGYRVEVGPTNFLLIFVPNALKAVSFFRRHNVQVRYFSSPTKAYFLGECVRISVGDEASNLEMIKAAEKLLKFGV